MVLLFTMVLFFYYVFNLNNDKKYMPREYLLSKIIKKHAPKYTLWLDIQTKHIVFLNLENLVLLYYVY